MRCGYPCGTGNKRIMADCATIEEGIACANAGADFVGTTMRGYTPETQGCDDIDFDFIHELSEKCPAKIIAEGHIHYPEQAKKALEAGAFALVVGGAITRPAEITATFVELRETETCASEGGAALMERVKGLIHSYHDFEAIGISTAGEVNTEDGSIFYANSNIPGYTGMPVKQIMEEEFCVPAAVENDVNAAALGDGNRLN